MPVRRSLLLFLIALVFAGCGEDDPSGTASAPEKAGDGAFPATVDHEFGTTTVEKKPERIVVVGLTEQDVVLQLGYKPIATTEWYGEQPSAVWPWAQEALGDSKPTVLEATDGFAFEKIAGLNPDLIIGVNAGIKKKDYEKLSQLAPTVAGPKGEARYFSPWDVQVEMISQALGKAEEGKKLVADVKKAYADAAAEHPDFKGKTATFSQNGFYNGLIYVYPDGLNTEFLTYLGFKMNPKITALADRPGEQVAISEERLDTLDADVIVFATEKASDIKALEKVPTFEDIKAVTENRSVYTDGTLAGALYFMTPLSLEYALDRLVPQLQKAVDGEAPREMMAAG